MKLSERLWEAARNGGECADLLFLASDKIAQLSYYLAVVLDGGDIVKGRPLDNLKDVRSLEEEFPGLRIIRGFIR